MSAQRSRLSALTVLFFLSLLVSPALADTIDVPNGDFSAPYVAMASPYALAGAGAPWQQSPVPSWWTAAGYTVVQWADSVATFVNVPFDWIDNLVPAGGTSVHQQAVCMFATPGLEISQQLTNTFQVGQSYQLTVGIQGGGYGMPLGCPMEIGLYYLDGSGNQVMVGTTQVLNDNPSPTGDITDLPDRVLTIPAVAATDPWAGQNIGIALLQTATGADATGFWDIGNVRLATVPEPSSLAMLAVGLGVLVVHRWRVSKK